MRVRYQEELTGSKRSKTLFGEAVEFPLVVFCQQRRDYFGDDNRGEFFLVHRELNQKSYY